MATASSWLVVLERSLRHLQGRTLASVAKERGADPVETLVDLVVPTRTSAPRTS